jgi:hypothetical protein
VWSLFEGSSLEEAARAAHRRVASHPQAGRSPRPSPARSSCESRACRAPSGSSASVQAGWPKRPWRSDSTQPSWPRTSTTA